MVIKRVTEETLDLKRQTEFGTVEQQRTAEQIIASVKRDGDASLYRWTTELDGARLTALRVTPEETAQAYDRVETKLVTALQKAANRIRRFHERQTRPSWWEPEADGTILGQWIRPLSTVGVYVPGGRAAYPSSVLMNVLPAQVAGVNRMVMVTPPSRDGSVHPAILVAADIAGVSEIYKVGGAQAIAALAHGTETVPRVDKIVGPGNQYVALAKRSVYGLVDIDMIAGPSEIVILADDSANPEYAAADLLSQAEHDPLASAILVTPSEQLADAVTAELEQQCAKLDRADIASQSLADHGAICIVPDLAAGLTVVNRLAPEHLELLVENPWKWLGGVAHAGAIFIGPDSPEPVGDYWAGPNHVLPTNGTARFASPLSVDDFVKRSSVIAYSRTALARDASDIIQLAESEGLGAHAAAIRKRVNGKEEHHES